MSASAAQASAFYDEALAEGSVWTLRDGGGIPAPLNSAGQRAMPFWSKETRVVKVRTAVPAYQGFETVRVPLDEWRTRWLPGLANDKLLVGLNWSGESATGYDVHPIDVEANSDARGETAP